MDVLLKLLTIHTHKHTHTHTHSGVCMENGTCEPLCKANETCSCSGESECLLCCMDGEDCLPVNGTLYLPNGSPCSAGACLEVSMSMASCCSGWAVIFTVTDCVVRVTVLKGDKMRSVEYGKSSSL